MWQETKAVTRGEELPGWYARDTEHGFIIGPVGETREEAFEWCLKKNAESDPLRITAPYPERCIRPEEADRPHVVESTGLR